MLDGGKISVSISHLKFVAMEYFVTLSDYLMDPLILAILGGVTPRVELLHVMLKVHVHGSFGRSRQSGGLPYGN